MGYQGANSETGHVVVGFCFSFREGTMNRKIVENVLRVFFLFVFVIGTVYLPTTSAVADGGEHWLELSPGGTVPEIRYWHGGAYDSNSNRMIIFGGGQLDMET